MKLFDWFKSKPVGYEEPKIESVKPSDEVIEAILAGDVYGIPIPIIAQHVNWAAQQIGEEVKYTPFSPVTPKSMWVLYEGCRVYKETYVRQN